MYSLVIPHDIQWVQDMLDKCIRQAKDGVWINYFLQPGQHGYTPVKACVEYFYVNGGNNNICFKIVYKIYFNYKNGKVTVSLVKNALHWRLAVRALIEMQKLVNKSCNIAQHHTLL